MNCSKCQSQDTEFKQGVSKKSGKPWKGYKCNTCGNMDFIKSGYTPTPKQEKPVKSPINANKHYSSEEIKEFKEKERRMVRMNSYAHAVEIVKYSLPELTGEDTALEIVKKIAHQIENDVYRTNI